MLKTAFAMLLFLPSCSGSPADLIGEFQSYAPIATIEEELRREGREWVEVERNETPTPQTKDPFSFVRLLVAAYELSGVTGELELSFFNSQLMRVKLYPESSEGLDRLGSAVGLRQQGSLRTGHVLIRRDEDHRQRPFLSWEDERLVDEMNQWLRHRG